MNEKITRKWLVDHGFKSSGDRVYFLNDLIGYDLGIAAVFTILSIGINVTIIGGIIYIAYHFISKWW